MVQPLKPQWRILSWDIGKKNMAYCHLDVSVSTCRVLHWATVDLAPTAKLDGSKPTLRDCEEALVEHILLNQWMVTDVDVCVLESQSPYAPQLQCLASAIHTTIYTLARCLNQSYPPPLFVNICASAKFRTFHCQPEVVDGETRKQQYTKHKKTAQQLALFLLEQWGDKAALMQFQAASCNRDMADALCNGAAHVFISRV